MRSMEICHEFRLERKIGFSFLGLLAGNVVSFLVLLLTAALRNLHAFAIIERFSKLDAGMSIALSIAILVVSMLGWVVVGLPVLLLLSAEIVAGFFWITSALTGAVLGMLAMLLFIAAVNHQDLHSALFANPAGLELFLDAALVAGVAFAVYGAMVKVALQRQAKENGAPKGAPRSFAWFDF